MRMAGDIMECEVRSRVELGVAEFWVDAGGCVVALSGGGSLNFLRRNHLSICL